MPRTLSEGMDGIISSDMGAHDTESSVSSGTSHSSALDRTNSVALSENPYQMISVHKFTRRSNLDLIISWSSNLVWSDIHFGSIMFQKQLMQQGLKKRFILCNQLVNFKMYTCRVFTCHELIHFIVINIVI